MNGIVRKNIKIQILIQKINFFHKNLKIFLLFSNIIILLYRKLFSNVIFAVLINLKKNFSITQIQDLAFVVIMENF